MSYPLAWPSWAKFYPMGINPAISLTQDLSPEQSADILLLGCGDPRNILYTISTDVTAPPTPRKLDITCCDLDQAVLARNIMLYTLIEDDTPSNVVWDIFYHFKISEHSFGVLVNHAQKLADLSEEPEVWNASQYSSFIKFVDRHSLVELHRYWSLYAKFPKISNNRLERLKKQQTTFSGKLLERLGTSVNGGASRSATMFWRDAAQSVSDQFGQYWKNGTTATTGKDILKATLLNPTFCYSDLHGEAFDVYENTFPQGFHFTPAFAPVEFDPVGSNVTSAMAKAKQQFKASCLAFQASRKAKAVTLRFFVGDAFALCKAFELYAEAGDLETKVFSAPWRAVPIDLVEYASSTPKPPVSFDVIDTSMLVGFMGIPNILLATQPLLKKQPASQAIMYMDISLPVDWSASNFVDRLCGTIPTLALLVGLVPRSVVSAFTSHSNTHEHVAQDPYVCIERVAWVEPTGGDNHARTLTNRPLISVDAPDLAKVIFTIYSEMFHRDCAALAEMTRFPPEVMRMYSAVHSDRSAVAALWTYAQKRFVVGNGGLDGAINSFIGLIKADRENWMSPVHHADLLLQFRLRGLPFRLKRGKSQEELSKFDIFGGWTDIPQMVCVVLTVPRSSLEPLRNDTEEHGSPRFVCHLKHPESNAADIYSTIHAVWGSLIPIEGSESRFTIEEDSDGFRGTSDLVVSFWVDSNALAHQDIQISFALRFTPLTLTQYGAESRQTGEGFVLFSTPVENKEHVSVLRERPMGFGQTQPAPRLDIFPAVESLGAITHRVTVTEIEEEFSFHTMETQIEIESDSERAAISKGKKPTISQIGPCTMQISIGQTKRVVAYPYPIRGSEVKLNFEKKERRLNLSVPLLNPIESGGYPHDPFPLLQHGNYSPWNIHHVYLDRMPKLDVRDPAKLPWLVEHTALQMSDRERFIQHCTQTNKRYLSDVLVNIKESLATIIKVYAGLDKSPCVLFGLNEPLFGTYMGICANGLRLDLAAGTVVLDAAVVHWSPEVAQTVGAQIQIYEVETRPGDVAAWKRLMTAYVERCRTWSHGPNCEYNSTGNAPLSVAVGENPLCSCGRGIGLKDWKLAGLEHLLPHGTRAAISPLFGAACLDVIVGPGMKLQGEKHPVSWDQPSGKCWRCGKGGRMPIPCPKCKKAKYCSRECQRRHKEEEHQYVCKPPEIV